MHALLITFDEKFGLAELRSLANEAAGTSGLVTSTWFRSGKRYGGFCVFSDGPAAEAFRVGILLEQVSASGVGFEIRHLEVLDEPESAVTRDRAARVREQRAITVGSLPAFPTPGSAGRRR